MAVLSLLPLGALLTLGACGGKGGTGFEEIAVVIRDPNLRTDYYDVAVG